VYVFTLCVLNFCSFLFFTFLLVCICFCASSTISIIIIIIIIIIIRLLVLRRRLVPSSRRVGSKHNMMLSESVFSKPRCCVDVQAGPVNYVICPSPSLSSSSSSAADTSRYNVFIQTARLPHDQVHSVHLYIVQ